MGIDVCECRNSGGVDGGQVVRLSSMLSGCLMYFRLDSYTACGRLCALLHELWLPWLTVRSLSSHVSLCVFLNFAFVM